MVELEFYFYPLIALAGMVAGIINTLAGNGSAITLSLLIFLGLPVDMANGTNRIGVLAQSITAASTFRKRGLGQVMKQGKGIIAACFLGAILGAFVVAEIDEGLLEYIVGGLMVVMLFVVLFNPKRWLQESSVENFQPNFFHLILFFVIGFYGGFIQMGFGIFFLGGAVLFARYSLIDANIIKIIVVFLFAAPVLGIFIWHGDVAWIPGLTLAVGQALGGWLGARFAINYTQANVWIRRLLIVMIMAVIVRLFFG